MQHLRGMIEVRLPDYNYAAFRYHDPTVIERYVTAIDFEARERFLGPLALMAWPKQVSSKKEPDQWTWRALLASEEIPDEDNPYLYPQPVIDITDEQLAKFKKERYKSIARMLDVNGVLHNGPERLL